MAQTLGSVAVGSIVKLNENGSPVDFYVACHNYEQSLNGTGRTLLVRFDCYDLRQRNSSNVNIYANSSIDSWLNNTYKNLLDSAIQDAIGTTKFYYTPGNGNYTLGTLERAIFILSTEELGKSDGITIHEGSELPMAAACQIALLNGVRVEQWTRTPRPTSTSSVYWLNTSGDASAGYPTNNWGSRPAFTLPSTLLVLDDGTVITAPASPSTLTVPQLAMQGQQISVSWSAVDGADGYILERKADTDADWTQVYSGANLSFAETVGTWTSVQYRVKAGVSGTYGDYTTSESIPVVSASAVVISGTDGDLGTLTSDVSYTVSSSGTSELTVVETINGVSRTYTATNGATNKISVLDLPTGTGSIVIQASTNPGSGVVSVTRSWTYSKTAPTFANSGSTAQLHRQGANIFPFTLAECVRGITGGLGDSLDKALEKLSNAALYENGQLKLPGGGEIPSVQIETGSYVGTGTYGAGSQNVLTFQLNPKLVIVSGKSTQTLGFGTPTVMVNSATYTSLIVGNPLSTSNQNTIITWGDKQVSWYSTNSGYQKNDAGETYYYIAIGLAGGTT